MSPLGIHHVPGENALRRQLLEGADVVMSRKTTADHAAEHLALDLVISYQRISELNDRLTTVRLMAQLGIHQLHEMTLKHERLKEAHYRLIEEYRELREQVMGRAVAE
jgi:hypothetical protein